MINNREHSRHPIGVSIKITHESIGELLLETKDISDGGLFVAVNPEKMPPLGTIVEGQVQGMAEDPPIVEMEVVRVTNNGIGLKYINT
jgi:hypothetical protein